MKTLKGLRELLAVLMTAIPQVGNLGLLFFLLFFIFAALGVELFGRLDCPPINPCEGLSRHANFEDFFIAFLTLFRVATGDNWNGIMKDTLRKEHCDSSPSCVDNCCANQILAPVFFVTFVLMAQFVLVNVVVAVLMKHLEESHKMADSDDNDDLQALEDKFRMEASEAEQQEGDEDAPVPDPLSSNNNNQEQENAFTPLLKETLNEDLYSPRRPSISMANLTQTSEYIEESFKPPAARVKSLPVSLAVEQDTSLGDEDTESHYTAHDETPSPVRKPAVPTIHLMPPDIQTSLHPPRSDRGTPVPPRKHSKQSPHRTLSATRRRNASQTDSLSSGESYRTCEEDVTVKPSSSFQRLHDNRNHPSGEGGSAAQTEEVPLHLMSKKRGSPRLGAKGSQGTNTPEPKRKTPPRSPKLRRISPKSTRKSKGSPSSLKREENSRSRLLDGNSSSGESDSQHLPLARQSIRDCREASSLPDASLQDERTRIDEKDEALISWDSDDQDTASGLSRDSRPTEDRLGKDISRTLGGEEETKTRRRSPHQRRDIHINSGGDGGEGRSDASNLKH